MLKKPFDTVNFLIATLLGNDCESLAVAVGHGDSLQKSQAGLAKPSLDYPATKYGRI